MKSKNYKELASVYIETQLDGTEVHIIVSQNDYHDLIIAKQLTKLVNNKRVQHIVKFPIKLNKTRFKELAEILKNIADNVE